jgi:hypothetical protein
MILPSMLHEMIVPREPAHAAPRTLLERTINEALLMRRPDMASYIRFPGKGAWMPRFIETVGERAVRALVGG